MKELKEAIGYKEHFQLQLKWNIYVFNLYADATMLLLLLWLGGGQWWFSRRRRWLDGDRWRLWSPREFFHEWRPTNFPRGSWWRRRVGDYVCSHISVKFSSSLYFVSLISHQLLHIFLLQLDFWFAHFLPFCNLHVCHFHPCQFFVHVKLVPFLIFPGFYALGIPLTLKLSWLVQISITIFLKGILHLRLCGLRTAGVAFMTDLVGGCFLPILPSNGDSLTITLTKVRAKTFVLKYALWDRIPRWFWRRGHCVDPLLQIYCLLSTTLHSSAQNEWWIFYRNVAENVFSFLLIQICGVKDRNVDTEEMVPRIQRLNAFLHTGNQLWEITFLTRSEISNKTNAVILVANT